MLFLMGLLALGLAGLALARRQGGRKSIPVGARAVAAAAIASTLFWFLSAPDIRFGYGALFVLAALPLALALTGARAAAWPLWARRRLAVGTGVALLAFSAILLNREGEWRPVALVPPAPPRPVVEERQTAAGETVRVPVRDDRCWDAPRPCTPFFDPRLAVDRDLRGRPRVFSLLPLPAGAPAP
jgi:hypothetical protein